MSKIARAAALVAGVGAFLCGVSLAAAQRPADPAQVHVHDGMDHGAMPRTPSSEDEADYLTVNVQIMDGAIQPPVVFVPSGHPVQLLLRNRGSSEHHYHVVGLVPDDLVWVSQAGSTPEDAATDDEEHSHHHDRQFVRSRETSPAGIRPTGKEIHAYVSVPGDVDAVLFSVSQTGTFVVRCDLHPEEVGKLTVFDSAPPTGPASPRRRQALTLALSRNLGSVSYPGAADVLVEATYAPPEYVTEALGGEAAVTALQPGRHIAVMLTERTHTTNLPSTPPPDLYVSGSRVPLVDRKVMTDSVHHRATFYRFARDDAFGKGHQVMTLRLASGQEATWHLPLILPAVGADAGAPVGLGEQWGLILALMGGMVAAMWPCLFQLTVYFIPALAGIAMQNTSDQPRRSQRRQVLVAAFYFILGFTLVYTATGALIGFAAQQLGDTAQFDVWQRYVGIGAGIVVIGLALRVAAKVRAPLICKMPILSGMANSKKPATRLEMMLAGLAFATGCMTCFGSALVVGMVVYIGLAQSAFYGALVLFLFSLGMGIPLVIAAVAMARALPFLMKLEKAVPWMGLASAVLMAGFGTLLISGNYMVVSEWTFRTMEALGGR